MHPVVGTIRWANDYISNALSANPYASLAWAGVSLLLPVSSFDLEVFIRSVPPLSHSSLDISSGIRILLSNIGLSMGLNDLNSEQSNMERLLDCELLFIRERPRRILSFLFLW